MCWKLSYHCVLNSAVIWLIPPDQGTGVSQIRDFRLLAKEATLQVRADRTKLLPYGSYAGKPGAPSQKRLKPNSKARIPPPNPHRASNATMPSEISPPVQVDVLVEKVTLPQARHAYCVVIDSQTWEVNESATKRLRKRNG